MAAGPIHGVGGMGHPLPVHGVGGMVRTLQVHGVGGRARTLVAGAQGMWRAGSSRTRIWKARFRPDQGSER